MTYKASTGQFRVDPFRTLADRLPPGTLLVGNQTRVIHARLHFPLAEGKRPIEIFCLDPLLPVDHAQNLGALTRVQWKCLIGGNRRWKRGQLTLKVPIEGSVVQLSADRVGRQGATFTVSFDWKSSSGEHTFGEVLEAAGTLPIPPYLGRDTEAADEDRYQTVFAKIAGSVAAPTAGLHFTPRVMDELTRKGIAWDTVTLHVGAGTFRPVSSPTLGGHDMHKETFSVTRQLIEDLLSHYRNGGPVVSVGTTTLRCLESLHCLGAELHLGRRRPGDRDYRVGQWAFEDAAVRNLPREASFAALASMMATEGLATLGGQTEVLLSSVSGVRAVDGLITNFHQPKSTLLLLISAILKEEWRAVYQIALAGDFRFLSYGDSSLLWR